MTSTPCCTYIQTLTWKGPGIQRRIMWLCLKRKGSSRESFEDCTRGQERQVRWLLSKSQVKWIGQMENAFVLQNVLAFGIWNWRLWTHQNFIDRLWKSKIASNIFHYCETMILSFPLPFAPFKFSHITKSLSNEWFPFH